MNFQYFELLQLNDATFPIGNYAFSWGLETFVQQEIIHDAQTAESYIRSELEGSFLYGELLISKFAFFNYKSAEKLTSLDKIYEASKVPFEIRDGSRKLAARFLKITKNFSENADETGYVPQYFPVEYGSYCAKRNFDLEESLSAFVYSQMSARVTTAVKLVPLSQTDGQKILFDLMKEFSRIVKKCLELSENELCLSAPGIDIRAMQHEWLYTRLYSN